MMNNNKILTVSYGTFSCTLEGFDDSFGTMKAIAEYFRDLAADDRYFGAEPPQPDAEMLARIAQKEISRRVHAREHDGKIVLSALEDNRPAPPAPPAADGAAAMASANHGAAKADGPAVVEDAPRDATTPVAVDTADEDEKAVAAEAHVELDVVTDTQGDAPLAKPPADPQDDTLEPISVTPSAAEEEAPATATDELPEDPCREDTADHDENGGVRGQPDEAAEAFFADIDSKETAQDFEDETSSAIADEDVDGPALARSAATAPAPDSIAAKLQRIRAVVAQHEEAEEDSDYVEDQHAVVGASVDHTSTAAAIITEDAFEIDTEQTASADTITQARHDIEDALVADDAAEEAARMVESQGDGPEQVANDYDAILARLDQDDDPSQTGQAAETSDNDELASDDASETNEALANLFGNDDIETEFNVASVQEELQDQSAPVAPRARVIKVKRADLEAAIERGELEEYGDSVPETTSNNTTPVSIVSHSAADAAVDYLAPDTAGDDHAPDTAGNDHAPDTAGNDKAGDDKVGDPALDDLAPAKTNTSSLSAEDEQDLARELAELERDIEGDAPEVEASAVEEAKNESKEPGPAPARQALPKIEDETTGDMSRLMAEADHQMDEPESATRRNAFAHLRAAVAAKKADAAIGISDDADKVDDAYRSDLAEVVRPRRPVSGSARTARPEEARPAPLKLVAEQRIDVDAPHAAGPVRPRRVAAEVPHIKTAPVGVESFADYAEDRGATSLSELLEAAASYLSFVEGCEQFSRPQLMSKVRQVGPQDGFSREDGLRSFGQLLRAGKIEKIKGGRFTVSEDIGYRPDQRAAS